MTTFFLLFLYQKMLNVSETVIRKKVDEMNEMLVQAHLGSIEKKPRKGIRLIYDPQNAQKIADLFSNYEYIDITAGEELLYVYLRVLLSSNVERITVTRLSEMVYQSVPVCSRHLETCTQWLSLFNIQLSIKRNYGISLQGSEENKRLAIKHLVINDPIHSVEQSIQQFAKGINLELLKSCIADIERSGISHLPRNRIKVYYYMPRWRSPCRLQCSAFKRIGRRNRR